MESLLQTSGASLPFCVEISLRTPEQQTMILETWCISFNEQLIDATQKVCYNVYKKMSLVLRSLMCITRSTPTYQLSRRQSSDTYVLLYKMYCGEPVVHHLGENYATSKVGTVSTPIGSIVLNLAYRTRLTMTPQTSSHLNDAVVRDTGGSASSVGSNSGVGSGGGGIQIKDDHFFFTGSAANTSHPQRVGEAGSPFGFETANNRYSLSCDMIHNTAAVGPHSPSSPSFVQQQHQQQQQQQQKQQQQYASSSSLSKRSSSNLDTIIEASSSSLNRQPSKTQPIPMRSTLAEQSQQQQAQQQTGNHQQQQQLQQQTQIATIGGAGGQQIAIHRQVHQQQQQAFGGGGGGGGGDETSSADEYTTSSVGSTPDTVYYFKLKSAAFVPSASFSNTHTLMANMNAQQQQQQQQHQHQQHQHNTSGSGSGSGNSNNNYNYYSASNLSNEMSSDLPPFITLISADMSPNSYNNNNSEQQRAQMAKSPPPPQLLHHAIDFQNRGAAVAAAGQRHNQFGGKQQQQQQQQQQHLHEAGIGEHMASPCSLPNFKMLDTYSQQQQFVNNFAAHSPNSSGGGATSATTKTKIRNSSTNTCMAQSSVTAAGNSSNNPQADDFVFIDSVNIHIYTIVSFYSKLGNNKKVQKCINYCM